MTMGRTRHRSFSPVFVELMVVIIKRVLFYADFVVPIFSCETICCLLTKTAASIDSEKNGILSLRCWID